MLTKPNTTAPKMVSTHPGHSHVMAAVLPPSPVNAHLTYTKRNTNATAILAKI
jgi:hypothetical protein